MTSIELLADALAAYRSGDRDQAAELAAQAGRAGSTLADELRTYLAGDGSAPVYDQPERVHGVHPRRRQRRAVPGAERRAGHPLRRRRSRSRCSTWAAVTAWRSCPRWSRRARPGADRPGRAVGRAARRRPRAGAVGAVLAVDRAGLPGARRPRLGLHAVDVRPAVHRAGAARGGAAGAAAAHRDAGARRVRRPGVRPKARRSTSARSSSATSAESPSTAKTPRWSRRASCCRCCSGSSPGSERTNWEHPAAGLGRAAEDGGLHRGRRRTARRLLVVTRRPDHCLLSEPVSRCWASGRGSR